MILIEIINYLYGKEYIMKNRYQHQLAGCYTDPPLYLNKYKSLYQNKANMSEVQSGTGFISLYMIDQVSKEPIPYATITVYVTDGSQRDIQIMHLVTTLNPVRIELPMANELGTQIVGPEYDFSTYNISIDVFGYFTHIFYDIRLFPNVTTSFRIEMVPVTQVQLQPIIEERTTIPPHPRDEVIDSTPPSN